MLQLLFESFRAADLEDQHNGFKWIPLNQTKKELTAVYEFMKANQDILNKPDMTFHGLIELVSKATGVYGHSYCND